MIPAPGVYTGTIRHRRVGSRPHEFTYRLFMVFLDVDRVQDAMAVLRLTSCNRWNLASFDERDHLGDASRRLRERVTRSAPLQTITVHDWRFDGYLDAPNWIAKYIFPGAELASLGAILASLARTTRLSLYHAEQIGTH